MSHKDHNIAQILHLPKYFDFAAATPVHLKVVEAMMPYFSSEFYNPSALYEHARTTKRALEEARSSVARVLGAKPSEIVFTAGASESISLAIQGVMNLRGNKDASMLISAIEHDGVVKTAERYSHEVIGVDNHGMLFLEDVKKALAHNQDICLMSVVYASNEIGTIQQIRDLARVIGQENKERKRRGKKTVLLHVDASQAPLYLDCHPSRLAVDLMTLNGGKMYGPKQSGVLYVRSGIKLEPIVRGGGQEFGLRSGTENIAFAVGFAKALDLAEKNKDNRVKQTTHTRDYLVKELEDIGGKLYGHRTKRVAHNVLIGFEGVDNEELLIKLDALGFSIAIGSACHASTSEPSHVLKALGVSDNEAQSTIRLSINEYTTEQDCDDLIKAISDNL